MLISKFCLFLALFLLGNSYAQDLVQEENKYLGYVYQQQEYQVDDAKGDLLLLWTSKQIPISIINNLRGKDVELRDYRNAKIAELLKKYPEYVQLEETENVVVDSYVPYRVDQLPLSLEGHKAPFKVSRVVRMLKQIIVEEFQNNQLVPSLGKTHQWSHGTKKKYSLKFPFFTRFSKILLALSRGVTSNFMVSGTEHALKKYILSRPEDSINLEEMFRASYCINQGDVYLSLLTIENVLSKFWLDHYRSRRAITTKLKDITNFYYRGDKFGNWYHLFGIVLYGYAQGAIKSKIVGKTETVGSHIMGHFQDEEQEDFVNRKGGAIGNHLRQFVQRQGYLKFEANADYTKESYFMTLDEDFTKRLEKKQRKEAKKARKEAKKKALEL